MKKSGVLTPALKKQRTSSFSINEKLKMKKVRLPVAPTPANASAPRYLPTISASTKLQNC